MFPVADTRGGKLKSMYDSAEIRPYRKALFSLAFVQQTRRRANLLIPTNHEKQVKQGY